MGSLFCFGSDALQVLAHPTLSRSLDESALADYLTGHLEDPGSSFFRGIRSLPPAHRLVATAGGDRTVRYWDIPAAPETCADGSRSPEGTFLEIFRQAVADRLRTPGNVGVAMSGGLDSCSVAAVAHRIAGSSGQRIRACSLVFDLLPDCDERPYIRAMSEELGVEVEPFLADSLWDLEVGPRHNLDSPFPGWPSCYGLMLERLTSLGGGVLLTGHGGDDLFRGSPLVHADRLRQGDLGALSGVLRCARHHRESSWRTFYRLIWQPLFPRIDHVLRRALLRQSPSLAPQWLAPGFVRRTRDAEPRKSRVPDFGSRSLAARQIYDNTLLIPWYRRIVHWHDRNAAAYGIEVRHPFLDRRLFEHVLSIPPALLHEPGSYKPFLRRTMKGVLPEAVRCRPTKTRFRSFLDFVLQERERHRIESLLVDSRSSRLGIINAGELRSAFQRFCEGTAPAEWRGPLWYAVTLELWLRRLENLVGEFELGEAEAEEAAA
ncbi:MAG TPA: asparagine synthetase B family protein [Thermoanaerobaculia bacterium]